jgi:hypothetical protein
LISRASSLRSARQPCSRQAFGVDEPEQVRQALVVVPWLPVLVVPGPVQVTEATVERHGQGIDRLVTLAECVYRLGASAV